MTTINSITSTLFSLLCILCATGGIYYYLHTPLKTQIIYSLPNMDNSHLRIIAQNKTNIGGIFNHFQDSLSVKSSHENWIQFRGGQSDNIVTTSIPLLNKNQMPKTTWNIPLGEGYAGAIIDSGRVYVLDYSDPLEADLLRCFNFETGKELWQRGYKNPIRRNHGKSRTVPAIANNVVVSLGPSGHIMACDAIDGSFLWGMDFVNDFKTTIPQWYTGQCPLVDQDAVILAPAGDSVLMMKCDLKTGKILWKVSNHEGYKMSHASIIPMVIHGVRQYVYCAIGGLVGVSETGEKLWSTSCWKAAVWAPSAIAVHDNHIYATAGYGAGAALIAIDNQNNQFSARLVEEFKPTQAPACEQQTPLFYKNLLISLQPKDAGPLRAQIVAADPSEPKKIISSSGKENRFGLGPYIIINEELYTIDDEGVMTILGLKNNQFSKRFQQKVLQGIDAWGPIAYADGFIIIRDSKSMSCIDLRKEQYE